ncbi:MAG: PadR family transcriptional regulator [bacterium]
MIDLLIFSTIYKQNLSGYAIKAYIDGNYSPFFKISTGAIYPVLKKLINNNLIIENSSFSQGGQKKIIYSITNKGKDFFLKKLLENFSNSPQNAQNEFIAKFLCLNELEIEYKLEIINKLDKYLEYEKLKLEKHILKLKENSQNKFLLRLVESKQFELNEKKMMLKQIKSVQNL